MEGMSTNIIRGVADSKTVFALKGSGVYFCLEYGKYYRETGTAGNITKRAVTFENLLENIQAHLDGEDAIFALEQLAKAEHYIRTNEWD